MTALRDFPCIPLKGKAIRGMPLSYKTHLLPVLGQTPIRRRGVKNSPQYSVSDFQKSRLRAQGLLIPCDAAVLTDETGKNK